MDYFRCLKTITQANKNLIYLEEEKKGSIYRAEIMYALIEIGIQFEFKEKRKMIAKKK